MSPNPEPSPTDEDAHGTSAPVVLNTVLLVVVGAALLGGLWLVLRGPGDGRDAIDGTAPDVTAPPAPSELDRIWAELDRPWQLSPEALDAEWAAARDDLEAATSGSDEERALIAAFHALNEQAAALRRDPAALAERSETLEAAVAAYLATEDLASFDRVGWRLGAEFVEAIEAVLARARESGVAPALILEREAEAAAPWRAAVGNFFENAAAQGFFDLDFTLEVDPRILRAMFRDRWLRLSGDDAALSRVGPAERRALASFRIEVMDGLGLHDRLVLIGQNEDIYADRVDPDAVRGLVCFREGDASRARNFFSRAARNNPDDERYEAFLDYLVLHAR